MRKSRPTYVRSWLNGYGEPSPKAKYSWLTDSEPVPWGKGEKNPGEGSEIDPETVCVQAVGACTFMYEWLRTFCIMGQRVIVIGEVNRKGSRREIESE
jgi:hypothetical protein